MGTGFPKITKQPIAKFAARDTKFREPDFDDFK
jgi:hypothetical protein